MPILQYYYTHTAQIKCEIMLLSIEVIVNKTKHFSFYFFFFFFKAVICPKVALVVFCCWTESSESSNLWRDEQRLCFLQLSANQQQKRGVSGRRGA